MKASHYFSGHHFHSQVGLAKAHVQKEHMLERYN